MTPQEVKQQVIDIIRAEYKRARLPFQFAGELTDPIDDSNVDEVIEVISRNELTSVEPDWELASHFLNSDWHVYQFGEEIQVAL